MIEKMDRPKPASPAIIPITGINAKRDTRPPSTVVGTRIKALSVALCAGVCNHGRDKIEHFLTRFGVVWWKGVKPGDVDG